VGLFYNAPEPTTCKLTACLTTYTSHTKINIFGLELRLIGSATEIFLNVTPGFNAYTQKNLTILILHGYDTVNYNQTSNLI